MNGSLSYYQYEIAGKNPLSEGCNTPLTWVRLGFDHTIWMFTLQYNANFATGASYVMVLDKYKLSRKFGISYKHCHQF